MAPAAPEQVVVHPLVLLSVVDQFNRVAKDTKKRVVGVLLGETYKGRVDATNSFAGERRLVACPTVHQCASAVALLVRAGSLLTTPLPALQCPLRRTARTPTFGSWTTATWRT